MWVHPSFYGVGLTIVGSLVGVASPQFILLTSPSLCGGLLAASRQG